MDAADKFIAKAENKAKKHKNKNWQRENRQQNRDWWKKYKEYLQTPQWKEKRDAVIKRANGTCELCHNRKINEIHHLTYDRVFNELLGDLQGMCLECHVEHHRKTNKESKRLRLIEQQQKQKRRSQQSRRDKLKNRQSRDILR